MRFARFGTHWEAAEHLGITLSAVSHRLAMLEQVLGFDVAVRSGKGVALTPRGRRYAGDVRKSRSRPSAVPASCFRIS